MALPLNVSAVLQADDERAVDPRQISGQALGHSLGKIVLLRSTAEIRERKHHNGKVSR